MLEIREDVYSKLLAHLRAAGEGVRESGAFLLGSDSGQNRTVSDFLPYEKLQDDALNDDYVELNACAFSRLWEHVRTTGLVVVGDVHTHRFGPRQSLSDRRNPMIALQGHVAIIVPNFAQGHIGVEDLGIHIYQGSHAWRSFFKSQAHKAIRVGN